MTRSQKLLLAGIGVLTAAAWTLLLFRMPLLQRLPGGWFWKFHDTPFAAPLPVVGATLLGGVAIWHVTRHPGRTAVNLLLLVAAGYGAQLGLAFAEGRGIDGLRDRLVFTGHSELAVIAAKPVGAWDVATRYEAVVEGEGLVGYGLTKPPGALLFFVATQRVSGWFGPTETTQERFRTLVTFASWVYPLIACLALIPLFRLSRRLLPEETRWWPCVLYFVLPNVTLMTLHLDQVLFPSLFLLSLGLVIASYDESSWPLSLLAGFVVFVALFCSFSLVAACATAALFVVLREWRGEPRRMASARGVRWAGAFAAGLAGSWLAGLALLGYDPVSRFRNAMTQHEAFKGWEGGIGPTLYWAASNWLELAFWLGCPVVVLCLVQLGRAVRDTVRKRPRAVDTFAAAAGGVLLLLGLLGRTRGEVARLWLFAGGAIAVAAACAIADRFDERRRSVLALVVALQWVTVLLLKRYQDFW